MENKLLTREECESILTIPDFKGLKLRDYEIIPATDVIGFLGAYHRLILHCSEIESKNDTEKEDKSKHIFFVKSIPLNSIDKQDPVIFKKEAKLYAALLKDLQFHSSTLWCPKIYYTRPDLFVLQDLCCFGYEKCRANRESLSDAELKAILSTLAALHATSIALEEHTGFSIADRYSEVSNEISVSPTVPWFKTGLKTVFDLAKLHPAYQSEQMQNFIANELMDRLSNVFEMVNQSKKYRNVFCHRDPWHGNVLFNYTDMSAVLVDFQTCRYCPPSIDVIFAIFMNQGSDQRKALEMNYILWYYEKLKGELRRHNIDADKCLPIEELLCSYEDFKLTGLVYRVLAFTFLGVPADFITQDYKYVDRTVKLLGLMKSDTTFRNTMETYIGEILDYVTTQKNQNK